MYQAITKLNVNNPNDKIKKVNKNTDWAGNGSGFFLSSDGYIATNYHVIDNANKIEVEFKYKDEIKGFNAKVVQIDKTNDLAIIKIDDEEFSNINSIPYNFKTRSADVATEVFALGYPMALTIMGKEIKFTDGKISSKTGLDGDITTYQIQVPIQPGNSGGPLFDYNGNLIGITSSGVNRRLDITENVNYAIKSSYLLNLIDVLPEQVSLPSSTQLASKKLTEQIKVLSNYVVLIKVK
jgi:S1-C subfamily serine protease